MISRPLKLVMVHHTETETTPKLSLVSVSVPELLPLLPLLYAMYDATKFSDCS